MDAVAILDNDLAERHGGCCPEIAVGLLTVAAFSGALAVLKEGGVLRSF